jgi:hypothetical protein
MKPEEIDIILAEAAHRALPAEGVTAATERIKSALLSNLRPVQPLAPTWVFASCFVVLFAVFGVVSALVLGLHGIHALSLSQSLLIFSTLLATAWIAAIASAREMRIAAGSHLGTLALVLAVGMFTVLFSRIFRGYETLHLVREGIPCLIAGLCVSIPAGVMIAFILRRGFVMKWSTAGLAAGSLSGLTGLFMLELHCPNLLALHVMIWHVAVVAVSGILGCLLGWIADRNRGFSR